MGSAEDVRFSLDLRRICSVLLDVEMCNILPDVKKEFYKLASIGLCPNVVGQLMLSIMVEPPVEGEPSYPLYAQVQRS